MVKRIAVVVHVYYPHLMTELARCVCNVSKVASCDIFVTVVDDSIVTRVRTMFPGAKVRVVENRGYDLGPFFDVLRGLDLSQYDYVVKLHTKRDCTGMVNGVPLFGDSWRRYLLRFVSTPEMFGRVMSCMSADARIGMVGDGRLVVGLKDELGSPTAQLEHNRIVEALERLQLPADVSSYRFVGGTMFIARSEVLRCFQRSGLFLQSFALMNGRESGASKAHIYERVLGFAVCAQGYRVVGIPERGLFFSLASWCCKMLYGITSRIGVHPLTLFSRN